MVNKNKNKKILKTPLIGCICCASMFELPFKSFKIRLVAVAAFPVPVNHRILCHTEARMGMAHATSKKTTDYRPSS